jgi:inhibitor of cysteine peptidase
MKKKVVIGLVAMMLLPLVAIGCTARSAADEAPPLNGGQEAKMIEITTDDFAAQNDITRDIELIRPGSLIVTLGANPTTGFQWGEAEISDTSVIAQDTHNYVEPQSSAVGAPGKDVWVFDSKAPGTAIITMSYDRPWEGGEKGQWTLTINVTVK